MNPTETIEAVLRTLDAVTVSGKQNLDRLLGVMMALENLLQSLREEQNNNGNK